MIKQAIKGSKFGKALLSTRVGQALLAFKNVYRHDSYRQLIHDYADFHTLIKINECGALNDGKVLYVFNRLYPDSGFFWSWFETCRSLMVAERFGFTPVVDWSKGPFFDQNGLNGCMDPFEYFFEPVSGVSIGEALQSRNVVFYDGVTFVKPIALYGYRSDEELESFADINRRYIKLKRGIRERMEKDISELLGGRKTISVHVRGVEWGNIKEHPIPASLDLYTEKIDEAFHENGFEQVFLATDSDDTTAYFKDRYGDKVVFYNDVIRAKSGSKVLPILDKSIEAEGKGFRMGYEVLRDMMTLSACDGMIAGLSYVSFAAEVFKKSRGGAYAYKKYIEMKISKRGISPHDLV